MARDLETLAARFEGSEWLVLRDGSVLLVNGCEVGIMNGEVQLTGAPADLRQVLPYLDSTPAQPPLDEAAIRADERNRILLGLDARDEEAGVGSDGAPSDPHEFAIWHARYLEREAIRRLIVGARP